MARVDAAAINDDAKVQIARMRAQLNDLMSERVAPAVSNAMDRAQSVAQHQYAAVSDQVRSQPIMAVVIAAGVGFLLGRIWR